jgi:hypothetical protein
LAELTEDGVGRKLLPAVILSALLLALRWHLARTVGFGDAEALYAAYALHPQPSYLDHPGLVGTLARALGGGDAPTPLEAHQFTAIAATALPWLGLVAARPVAGSWSRAFPTFFALALWPELSIGSFALTPDLPLAFAWTLALGLIGQSLSSDPGSRAALVATVGAGFFAGLAVVSKASGALLLAALVATYATVGRAHAKTIGPWCALAVAVILVLPAATWEARRGFPLLTHRLIATQSRAGFSLRNLGALLGGQLLYVTPPFLLAAYRVLRGLLASKAPVDRLLLFATVIPGLPLILLCLWSRVAEPHWLAPAYLSLALGAARVSVTGTWLGRVCVLVGGVATLATFVVVATPLLPELSGPGYIPRYDLVNDLYSWRSAEPVLREEVDDLRREGKDPVIVGPHWTVCAQAHALTGADVPVGCRTPEGDDFQRWYPEATWRDAPSLLFVTDDRFPVDPATAFPHRDVVRVRTVNVYRGGRRVRTIRVARLDRGSVAEDWLRGALPRAARFATAPPAALRAGSLCSQP